MCVIFFQGSSGRRSTNPDVLQTAYAIEHITSRKKKKKSKVEARPTEELIDGLMFVMSPYPREFVVKIITIFFSACCENFVKRTNFVVANTTLIII